jgi:hypothetical protein
MGAGHGPLSSLGESEREKMIANAHYKLEEAEFFLEKLAALNRSRRLETCREFHFYFSAFLSAARSPLQILCPNGPDWGWVDAIVKALPSEDEELFTTFRRLRNQSIHVKWVGPEMTVEIVRESELPPGQRGRPAGFIYIPEFPAGSSPPVGITTYTLEVNGMAKPAVECCRKYLDLVKGMVDHRGQMAIW